MKNGLTLRGNDLKMFFGPSQLFLSSFQIWRRMCHNNAPHFNFSKLPLTAPLELWSAMILLEDINNAGDVSYITPYPITPF